MITYERSAFGLNLLFRIHGSATYRSVLPALMGVFILWGIDAIDENAHFTPNLEVGHPYAIGVVVSGITFLFVFRASQGYSRYWEAVTTVYSMMSKWTDATVHTASYHMQAKRYDSIKPPSYNDFPDLDNLFLTRDRERVRVGHYDHHHHRDPSLLEEFDHQFEHHHHRKNDAAAASHHGTGIIHHQRAVARSINVVEASVTGDHDRSTSKSSSLKQQQQHKKISSRFQSPKHFVTAESLFRTNHRPSTTRHQSKSSSSSSSSSSSLRDNDNNVPNFLTGYPRLDGNWSALFPPNDEGVRTGTFYDPVAQEIPRDSRGFASTKGGRTPPLFLQELAHLSSLMMAVALATLRNDVDGAESPLDYYEPGQPWPPHDPSDIPELYASAWHRQWATFLSFLGRGRTPLERTRYNAMRPLPVLGGVSNAEIQFLQLARGPLAKTQLCWHWLSEFITREHLAGSLGDVGPPIISRIIQFLGDGMVFYNGGRKIMTIPFPFVHAQLSAFFSIIMVGLVPYLMSQYVTDFWVAAMLTFLSLICLSGIHEVARELENPFRNVPNELPVVTLMAEYNEALLTIYAGYHPDAFWEAPIRIAAVPTTTTTTTTTSTTTATLDEAPMPSTGTTTNGGRSRVCQDENHHHPCSAAGLEETSTSLDVVAEIVEEDGDDDDATENLQQQQPQDYFQHSMEEQNDDELKEQQTTRIMMEDQSSLILLSTYNSSSPELDHLLAIVLEQGRAMTRMLEEQSRLNKLLEESLLLGARGRAATTTTTTTNKAKKKEV